MLRASHVLGIGFALVAVACGDASVPTDAMPPDADLDGGSEVDIPWLDESAPPVAPPVLTPCPSGWREVTEDGTSHCDPFPEEGVADCPFGQAHFVGDPACAPVGDPCPVGEFADGLPTDGSVIFVRAGAAPGGDGSRSAPLPTLSDVAFASLASGTTVALAKGSYEGALPLRGGVRVVGACAAETILTGVDGPTQAVVTVASGGELAVLRNVSFQRTPQSAVRVERAGGGLRLHGVIIESSTVFGVGLAAGELDAEELVVRDTREVATGTSGLGVWILGGHAEIGRAVLERNRYAAAFAEGEGTEVDIHDTLLRDTRPYTSSDFAYGLYALNGASFDVRRVSVSGNRVGVAAASAGTEVDAEDLIIRESLRGAGSNAAAIVVREAAHLSCSRVRIEDDDDAGLIVATDGSATLSDVVIRDIRSFDDAEFEGVGVQVSNARIELTRGIIERTVVHGVLASDDAQATLTDLRVRDISPRNRDGLLGRGIAAQFGSSVTLERAIVEEASEVGLLALDEDTLISVTDVAVTDTRPRQMVGDFGRGIVAQGGSSIRGERVLAQRNRELSIAAMLSGSLVLEHLVVSQTMSTRCDTGFCRETPHGHGIAAIGGHVEVSDFLVRQSETCGVMVARDGTLNLTHGEIRDSTIGACVQVPDFDLDHLTRDVTYRDNEANLEATTLPIPEPVSEI